MWHPQIRAFGADYRMVSMDLLAHGSLKDEPFRFGPAKDNIRRVIDEACDGRAIVVGQSMGGYLAMMLAAEHPDAVEGLVLTNCSAEPRSVARRAPGTIGGYLVSAARMRIRGHVPGPEAWPADEPHPTAEIGAFEPATHGILFRGGGRAVVAALRTRFIPHLAAYPGSTLILNGELDEIFRRSELDFLAACRDGHLVVVKGAGHIANIDGAEAYNAALRKFVAYVLARADGSAADGASANAAGMIEPALARA